MHFDFCFVSFRPFMLKSLALNLRTFFIFTELFCEHLNWCLEFLNFVGRKRIVPHVYVFYVCLCERLSRVITPISLCLFFLKCL